MSAAIPIVTVSALVLGFAACAVGPRTPAALPTPAHASERIGPSGLTIALYDPALFGPERPLSTLVKELRLPLVQGRLKNAHLLVNKAQRRLELWVRGRMVKAYRVQLGWNPYGPKVRQGDLRTPEGKYFICAHTPSEYSLALWISYPDTDDARRGLEGGLITANEFDAIRAALKDGKCPPQHTKLGGEILIHGQLQAGDIDPESLREYQDWTNGCIALFNPDIRELYEYVPDGTPITIVANGPVTPPPTPPRLPKKK
jgi:hypothetical protein